MLIWAAIPTLVVLTMLPLAVVLALPRLRLRGRREAALALHNAQLAEIDRDLAVGRLAPAEHAQARLEVQRRLLAAAELEEGSAARPSRVPLLATLAVVPFGALLLYLAGGHPGLPSMPLKARIAAAQERAAEEVQLIDQLRAILATADPHDPRARQGFLLLGNAEAGRGNFAAAAAAWGKALEGAFDPTLAAETAQAQTMAAGHVTPEAAALFRRALDEAPKDAPWRPMAERQLAAAEKAAAPAVR